MEEDVNDNLNYLEMPLNKKSNEIVIRKKAQLAAHDYAKIKGVYIEEVYTPIAHIEAIRFFLSLSCSLMFTLYQMGVKSVYLNRYLNVEVNQDVSNYVIDKNGVIDKDDYMEVDEDDDFPIANVTLEAKEGEEWL